MTGHGEVVKVTEAEIVYVNVDEKRRPVPIRPEPRDAAVSPAAGPE